MYMPRVCLTRRNGSKGWIACAAAMFWWLSGPMGAAQPLNISFYGQNFTHLAYGHSNPSALAIELRVQRPDGQWTVLASGVTSVSGQLRDADLDPGMHHYEIRQRVRVPDPNNPGQYIEVWQVVGEQTEELDGHKINGTLLYDETLSTSCMVVSVLTVPADRSLQIADATVTGFRPDARIDVYGDIGIGPAANVTPLIFLYQRAFHFDAPGQVKLVFTSGTQGSSLRGATNLYAEFYHDDFTLSECTSNARISVRMATVNLANLRDITLIPVCNDLTLTGVSNIWLELSAVNGAIRIKKSSINFSGTSQPNRTGNTFEFDTVVWNHRELRLHRPAVLRNCDFRSGLDVYKTTLTADDCAFAGLLTLEDPKAGTKLKGCFLRGSVSVISGASEFEGCEFAETVRLENRSDTRIRDSVLLGKIDFVNGEGWYPPRWHEASSPSPQIENNSFLGPAAFEVDYFMPEWPALIAIGANYYGDPKGVRVGFPEGAEFLGWGWTHEGAWVHHYSRPRFQFAPPLSTGHTSRKDKRVFPKFWVNDWIVGQNTLTHHGGGPLMVGRDTLVSVELLTSDFNVRNIQVYAEYNGERHYAKFTGPLSRDITVGRASSIWRGTGRLFDIVLPGHSETSMPLSVYADVSGIGGGFDDDVVPTDPMLLFSTTLNFNLAPPARDFVISVVPIKLKGLLFSKGPPSASGVARTLREQLPAMFPIPANRVKVRTDPPVTIWSSVEWVSAVPLMHKIAAVLSGRDTLCNAFLGNPHYQAPHFTVAVLPAGALHVFFGWGKADGANTKIFRSIVLVDESKPSAVIHELGHAIGLYRGKEQYDEYPPSGRALSAVTAFWTEGEPSGKFQAFNRALHFPGKWYNWYEDFDWYDVMSNVDETVWPIPATLSDFQTWLTNNLGRGVGSKSVPYQLIASQSEPPANHRRILLSGQTTNVGTTVQHVLIPATLALFDLTGQNFAPIPPPTNGIWQSLLNFRAYNAARTRVYSREFYVPTSPDRVQQWMGTFDIPNTAHLIAIEQDDWMFGSKTIAVWQAQGSITNRILTPAAGATVGTELHMTWQGISANPAWSTNLAHLVLFSTNGGASWLNPTFPQVDTQLVAQTDFLPRCGNFAIRLITSDGFTNFASTISGLQVANRAPMPTILEPREGDVSLTGAVWTLSAHALDYDGDLTAPGVWSSSLQGVLGSNNFVQCVLTQGTHTLRYVVRDAAGLSATATVSVAVRANVSSINLGIASNALQVLSRYSDPVSPVPASLLTVGVTNRLLVPFRVPAVPGSVRGTIQVRNPSGTVVLLHSQTNTFREAGWVSLRADFVPAAYGEYEVLAVLENSTPTDFDPSDNARVWRIRTRNPALTTSRRFVLLEYVLGPGEDPTPGQTYYNNIRINCFNTGLDNLRITQATLTGPNAAHCYIGTNLATNGPIAPTESSYLVVYCGATNRGAYRSTLNLYSNDPERPVATVDFLMMLYNYGTQVDTDGDGIYDSIEAVMGTDRTRADTDGDGLLDGQEDVNWNGIVEAGETSARLADTDGDGIPDGAEDSNRDGEWGYGETDPRRPDTDADGMRDGDELTAGTNPLDPNSYLGFTGVARVPGTPHVVIQWQSVDGKRYAVLRSTNIATGFTQVLATNILGVAPVNTVTDTTATGHGTLLYRIHTP